MKIKFLSRASGGLSEMYDTGLEYCFINENNEQCCKFVHCKDFLHDVVYALVNNSVASIYGFRYDPKKMPIISLDKTIIAVRNKQDKEFAKKIDSCVEFLNQIEKKLKLKRTVVEKCSNPGIFGSEVFILTGSPRWLEAPPMLSFYTLLIRVGFCHKNGTTFQETIDNVKNRKIEAYQESDASFLKNADKGIERILKIGYRKLFYRDITKNYPADIPISSLHNNFGIVGFSRELPKTNVGYWFKKKKVNKIIDVLPAVKA